jgi:hypothetical protein
MFGKDRVPTALAKLALALPLVVAIGCEKKPAPAATSSGGMPPLDEKTAAVPLHDRPTHDPANQGDPHAGMNLPPGHPALPPGTAQAEPTTPGDIEFDPKSVVSGVLALDPKVKSKVAEGDTIYLVARSADQPGPPLAVKKLTASKFPMAFVLDGRDAMMAGTKMSGKVTITARVDKDGDAMTKNPGDVTGTKTVSVPADKVILNLDTVL